MSFESFSHGATTTVNVADIERQLRALWDQAGPTVTRASLFNLVAVTRNAAEHETASGVISALTLRHPCRAIIVIQEAAPAEAAELSATVTALCHLAGGGGKQVCCELIQVRAAGATGERVSSAVLPLLESDLPTVVWYLGDFSDVLAQQRQLLAGATDRVIFDGDSCGRPGAMPMIQAAIQAQARWRFADLAWTRLGLWRKLLADCFDDAHAAAALPSLHRLEIIHGGGAGALWRARLFAGWVGTQLGWSAPELAQRLHLDCREEPDAAALGLLAVELSGPGVSVQVRKNFGEHTATARVTMPAVCGLPRRQAFRPPDLTEVLSTELDHAGRHPVYESALGLASGL